LFEGQKLEDSGLFCPSMGNLFEEEMVKKWEDAWEPVLAALEKVTVYAVVPASFSATCWNGAVLIRFC